MFCSNCGKRLQGDFCSACGTALSSEETMQRQEPTKQFDPVAQSKNASLLHRKVDKLANKLLKVETIRLDTEQLTEMINRHFIVNADEKQLQALGKTIKGNLWFGTRIQNSADGKFELKVFSANRGFLIDLILTRTIPHTVWIQDKQTNIFYQLGKDQWHKKLYKLVQQMIDTRQSTTFLS